MATATRPGVMPVTVGEPGEPQGGDAIPVELYLHTAYRPDMEYVDGRCFASRFCRQAEGELSPVADTLKLAGTPIQVPVAGVSAELDRYE